MFNYKGYKIFWHDHNNQVRDYFVCDADTGECLHYTSTEQCCMDAVDNRDFNLANRKRAKTHG